MSELRLTFSYIWNSFVNGRKRIGEGTYFYRADAAIYGALALSGALRRSRLIDFKEAYHGT